MQSLPRLLAVLFAVAMLTRPVAAQFAPAREVPATAELVSEVTTIAPGQPFRVALIIRHAPHWHTYYINPGQVGMAPALKWELPADFSAAPLRFPVPILGTFAGAPFYGYEGETWFLQTLTPPSSLRVGERVTLSGKATWLACKEQCVPGRAPLELTLPVAATATYDPARAAGFTAADAALPQPHPAWSLAASESNDTVTLHLRPGPGATNDLQQVHFFSRDAIEDASKPQELTKEDDGWRLTFTRHSETDPRPTSLNGILKAGQGWTAGNPSNGLEITDLVIGPPPAASLPADTQAIAPGLLKTFALMFLGGLILNLMPCVFPVIGLKIMGFVQQSGHDRKQVVTHGLVFTSGVLISFWILCALMLAGGIRNWGGQLQNPWVVLSLLLVMLVFGLSMFGVFELGSSATSVGGKLANQDGLSGSFFSGVLATVVATPCSAPILGTGLAATVALPTPLFLTSFTCMALGLSLPYLLLSVFPAAVEKLPRPGPWMESFKQGMSFLLFGTVAYLTWVYLLQIGDQLAGMKSLHVLLGLTVIATGFWIYGRWSVPYRSARARTLGRIFAAAFLVGGFLLAKPSPAPAVADDTPVIVWQEWSKEKQDALLREGKSVFVDFTARWCLTCQTNKAAAYTEATARLFKEHGIIALKADKTIDHPEIDAELTRLGQVAIPVNVFYAQGKPEPHITQTVLTAGYLQNFIRQHLGEPAAP